MNEPFKVDFSEVEIAHNKLYAIGEILCKLSETDDPNVSPEMANYLGSDILNICRKHLYGSETK